VVIGKLMEKWEARKGFRNFTKIVYVCASLTKRDMVKAIPVTGDTADMTVLTRANGYLLLPESKTVVAGGEKVNIHILPGLSYPSGYSGNFLSDGASINKRITNVTGLSH
jgi:molybdopterin biosynthesis enzyme